jgi:TolB-like protein
MLKKCMVLIVSLSMALWASTGLSVLYFENISKEERAPNLKKAIAEMVITELSGVKGISVVEREQLETVTKEIALGQSGLIDEKSAPKAGEMLGAQYLVFGSYNASRRNLMVTCKLIKVENGSVVKAQVFEGKVTEILKIANKVASAVIDGLAADLNDKNIQPPKDTAGAEIPIETVLQYENALGLSDKEDYENAKKVLKTILKDMPKFDLANKELSALEKRIQEYDRKHKEAMNNLKKEPLTYMSFIQVCSGYLMSFEYTKLLAYCMENRKNPPVAPEGSMVSGQEMLEYYIITAANALKKYDLLFTEAEAFLKKYPGSMYYGGVKMTLQTALQDAEQTRRSGAVAQAEAKIVEAQCEEQNPDLCNYDIAMKLFEGKQYKNSLDYFGKTNLKTVTKERSIPQDIILFSIFQCYYFLQDKKNAERIMSTVQSYYPSSDMITSMKTMYNYMPE